MIKKLLLVGFGAMLIVGSFFVGMKYKENFNSNYVNNTVQDTTRFDLDSLLKDGRNLDSVPVEDADEYNFNVGDNRTISPLKNGPGKITLEYVHEIKDVFDQQHGLSYRIYRVGKGAKPPKYFGTEGRIFLQVTEMKSPGYPSTMYDTGIDRVDPIGKVYLQGQELIVRCFEGGTPHYYPCEYKIDFSRDTRNIGIVRNI